MKQELVTLDFNGQAIAVYLIDGHHHALTDEQVGTLLGYATPAESVSKLVQRDAHGELNGLSVQVKLTSTDGKRYSKRVWDSPPVLKDKLSHLLQPLDLERLSEIWLSTPAQPKDTPA